MANRTIVGSFDSLHDAQRASDQLQQRGLAAADLNVVGNNARRSGTGTLADDAPASLRDDGSGAATGAAVGGVAGGLAGLAAGLVGLAVPGIGPVLAAGSLFTALAGAGAGALAGGLIGALTDTGMSADEAGLYAENVRRGGALLIVQAHESRVDQVTAWLRECGAIDIERRAQSWRESGWSGHDPAAAPYSWDEIERERARYGSSSASLDAGAPMNLGRGSAARTDLPLGSSPGSAAALGGGAALGADLAPAGTGTAGGKAGAAGVLGSSPAGTADAGSSRSVAGGAGSISSLGGRSGVSLGTDTGIGLGTGAGSAAASDSHLGTGGGAGAGSGSSTVTGAGLSTAGHGAPRESARGFGDWGEHEPGFRSHHAAHYGSGEGYDRFAPAYQYGGDLNRHGMYRDRQWDDIEADVRRDWESRNPGGMWDRFKAAVRHGWESTKDAAERVIPGDSDRDGR